VEELFKTWIQKKLINNQINARALIGQSAMVQAIVPVNPWKIHASPELLRATRGARSPNLNIAFTNACAAII